MFTATTAKKGWKRNCGFFDYWLKGIDNGLLTTKPVKLAIRNGAGNSFRWRWENEWPIARTVWTRHYLDASAMALREQAFEAEASVSYTGKTGGAHFRSAPFAAVTEITGPMKARVWISSSTDDADIFIDVRQFDEAGREVLVETTYSPKGPIAKGWLRASHRKLDAAKSTDYQPHHTHDELQKLRGGEIVALDVEIWPTSMVFPQGSTLQLSITPVDGIAPGQFYHTDPVDRPPPVFIDGSYTIHTGGRYDSHLLLPIVPSKGNV